MSGARNSTTNYRRHDHGLLVRRRAEIAVSVALALGVVALLSSLF